MSTLVNLSKLHVQNKRAHVPFWMHDNPHDYVNF